MRTLFWLPLMVVMFTCVGACSNNGAGTAAGPSGEKAVNSKNEAVKSGIVAAINNKTLAGYEQATIGSAFGNYQYFSKTEWKETVAPQGKTYVDCIGWFDAKALDAQSIKDGISAKALDVKFVVNPDGSFFVAMVSRIDAKKDGTFLSYPLEDSAGILTKIYANKQIVF